MASEARAAALVLCAVLAACEPTRPPDGATYDALLGDVGVYHWPVGRTIRFHVDDASAPADFRDATRRSLAAWQQALYYREHRLELTDDRTHADVLVRVVTAPRRVGTAGCDPGGEGAAGVTFFCRAGLAPPAQDSALTLPLLDGSVGRAKVEIAIDPLQAPAAGLRSLVAHEIGHALGIGGHSADPSDLMHVAPSVAAPSQRDAETLRWVLRLVPRVRL